MMYIGYIIYYVLTSFINIQCVEIFTMTLTCILTFLKFSIKIYSFIYLNSVKMFYVYFYGVIKYDTKCHGHEKLRGLQ
jgi:hypothetical protein